jgi:hypothetical protein
MSESPLLAGLNSAQYDAVLHDGGPLLVVAGAGSGKTRVLTHRIAHLIQGGLSPFEILAITFTNKAAGEMKHRVGGLVGPVAEKMWVSTFHSACVRILRRDVDRLGFPGRFSIYDQADAVRLVGYVIRDLNLDPKRFPPRSVHGTISMAKNENVGPSQFTEQAEQIFSARSARSMSSTRSVCSSGCHGLRRPLDAHGAAVPRASRCPRLMAAPLRSRPRRRVPGHQPRPERSCAPARRRAPSGHRRG